MKSIIKNSNFQIFRSLHFLFVHLFLILNTSILILLILGNEIVHVGLGFGEFHLVHALSSVPMEEGLSSEHRVNCSPTLLNISWTAVELPRNVTAILRPLGGISQTADLMPM